MLNSTMLVLLAIGAIGIMCHPEEEGGAFEGDMVLNPEQINALVEQKTTKNAFASVRYNLWITKGKADEIKYYITPEMRAATAFILQAVAEIETRTCLKFKMVWEKPKGSHIYFTTGNGCTSPVGRSKYGNKITLAPSCWSKATVMHEIGHSIGLFHEQSRPDRDDYVTIHFDKIQPRFHYAFEKYTKGDIDSRGTPYDYDSLMHYGSNYFSIDGSNTITTKDPKDQHRLGQRETFSDIDIQQISKMYCEISGSCQDNDQKCERYKKYCGTSKYLEENCQKSCGLCGGSGGGTGGSGGSGGGNCKDTEHDCEYNKKGCSEWGESWKQWMTKHCRRTCGFC